MKLGKSVWLAPAVTLLALVTAAPAASAAPGAAFNPENKIYVYGKVLGAHSVVLSADGVIQEIVSNTTEDVVPKVYRERMSKETRVPLTEDVYQQYRKLVPLGSSKVGVLYKRTTPPVIKIDAPEPRKIFDPFAMM